MRPIGAVKPIITCSHCRKDKRRKSYHQITAPTGTRYVVQPCKECKSIYDKKRNHKKRNPDAPPEGGVDFNSMMRAFRPERT